MIPCSICSRNFTVPEDVCFHIRKHHSGINEYRCAICNRAVFTHLWKYKRHLENVCFEPNPNTPDEDEFDSNGLPEFEKLMDDCALAFVCKLASKMNIPRNLTYEVVNDLQSFLSATILKGLDQYVMPHVKEEKEPHVAGFVQICREPFGTVNSEYQLDSALEKAEIISSFHSFKITSTNGKDSNEKPGGGVLMPLAFQFKKFFELPDVFEKTQQFAKEVSKHTNISHFLNADVWKNKLKSYRSTDIVIPFHLHIDDTQVNNALGSHRSKGLETCCYYSFPSIPPQYSSRLENIFAAQLFPADSNKHHGNIACFKELIDELNNLAQVPIILNINGREEKVYFVLGLILGDNKGINDVAGFSKSHNAHSFCRICTLNRTQTQVRITQDDSKMRNPENYDENLSKNDPCLTGIVEDSIINSIFLCHATTCLGVDLMHDVFEGILHYNMIAIILKFIEDKYFSLGTLNQLKSDFAYGEVESGDKSPEISKKSKKLLMSASEMQSFFHHFGLIVGHLVPKTDKTWKFYLETTKFVDLLYLPFYTDSDLSNLTLTISKMNSMFKKLFAETLKPKHHYITHYPTMIRRFGPLYYISSMRYESKHKAVKNYTKNTNSRINLSYSLARKLQYYFAYRLLTNIGLNDFVTVGSSGYTNLGRLDVLDSLENPQLLRHLINENLKETTKVTINGIHFSTKLYIVLYEDAKVILHQVLKIIYLNRKSSDIYFICKEFKFVSFNKNLQCYEVNTSHRVDTLKAISAIDVLKERQHPVTVQKVEGNQNMRFRTKRF